ncbi:MAG: hypothetical protein AMJ88_06200 [Anaerolineae bacterium SM23_ 63]|nr:MAG: hypothetical protein AMJ88_06200 [Anaerolineae bacterium SM23_ 63]HEY45441.1 hypothetical protein [Anaerolineae bacterium]
MKRVIHVSIIFVFLVALIPATSLAHTEDDKFVTNLIAGQHIDVGNVEVWNDGSNLFVQYVTSGDWCLTETHLAVAGSIEQIPTTKKGNPIPGQFDYKSEYDPYPCVKNPDPYVIPLSWGIGESVYIAAHAAVVQPLGDCYESVWQIGDVEVVNETTGWLENYADEFNWGEPADPITQGPSLAVEQPSYTDPFIVGTTPTDQFPFNSNKDRSYATDFDIERDGELPFGGRLTLSWSPGASGQEKKVISDGFPEATLLANGEPSPGQGWFLDNYPLVQNSIEMDQISFGTHTINFQHTKGNGTYWDWIKLEKVCEQWETAWGEGERFTEQGNWGMYFTYTIQGVCPSIIEMSGNIQLLGFLPEDVTVGSLEDDEHVLIWQEFLGSLMDPLKYDLDERRIARTDGPSGDTLEIPAGEQVCSYYVHLDNVGLSSTIFHTGYIRFETGVLGLIISGGNLGTFARRDLMFAADDNIGYSGTTYPDDDVGYPPDVNYLRGFDVNYGGNLDDAVFNGDRVDFTMWVVNAHDSMRIILPALPLTP